MGETVAIRWMAQKRRWDCILSCAAGGAPGAGVSVSYAHSAMTEHHSLSRPAATADPPPVLVRRRRGEIPDIAVAALLHRRAHLPILAASGAMAQPVAVPRWNDAELQLA